MKITLLAHTAVDLNAVNDLTGWDESVSSGVEDADLLAEVAGRACYESFHKPNAATSANRDYLANIISLQHFSVVEHGSATFFVEGVSRSLLTELERHRHLSFSVRSQRYVDESTYTAVMPPAIVPYLEDVVYEQLPTGRTVDGEDSYEDITMKQMLGGWEDDSKQLYGDLYRFLREKGLSNKQAREAARSVLPSWVEVRMVVTGNHRTWREIIQKRYTNGADKEIQNFAAGVRDILKEVAPAIYQDIT